MWENLGRVMAETMQIDRIVAEPDRTQLEPGTERVFARYKDKIYERDFTVKAGVNTDVEVLLSSGGNDANTNPGVVSDAQD